MVASPRAELLRFALMRRIGNWILPGYRWQWPQIAWWSDDEFVDYLTRFDESQGMNADRRWALYQLTRLVASVSGDTAECGVFKGASSYLICRALGENPTLQRTHFIFDSFEGISAPKPIDGHHWKKGDLACELPSVMANLRQFNNISWHKGWIPDRFVDVERNRFSFVHIDVDLYAPTRDSIYFFYPRLNDGGIIVCDDYGFKSCPGATAAIDEALADKPEKMVSLPSGGGFLVKGCETSERARL